MEYYMNCQHVKTDLYVLRWNNLQDNVKRLDTYLYF